MTIASPETLEYLRNRTPEQAAADKLRAEQSWANMTQGTKIGEKLEELYPGGNSSFGDLTPHPSITTPNVRTKIEEYLRQMDDSGGSFPWNDFDKYLGRPGSRPEDRILVEEQWGNTPGPAVKEPTIPGLGPGYGTTSTNPWPQSLPGGRINQAPRPEGFQRAATGIADWLTGDKWDFDQRGKPWKDAILFGSTGAAGGNTFAQDILGNSVGAGSSPEALNFLENVGAQLAQGGPALPGEPGRPGTPKAPGGRPLLPGEKPLPKGMFV